MNSGLKPNSPRPPVPRDDAQVTAWALAAGRGDTDAVEHFVHATRGDVRRFVAHLTRDAAAADDLTQETYLRALISLPRFAGRSCARTWLLSIARRVVVDRYRYDSARPRLSGSADWQSAAERAQDSAAAPGFDEGVALLDLLSFLDDRRREAFVLTQMLGLPYADAAAVTGCPIGTVRSRVARAREDMGVMLRAAEHETGYGTEPPPDDVLYEAGTAAVRVRRGPEGARGRATAPGRASVVVTGAGAGASRRPLRGTAESEPSGRRPSDRRPPSKGC